MAALRIAVAQSPITADARVNGRRVQEAMSRAAGEGARLIQFPEGMLSGYAKAQIASWDQVDWAVVRDELERVAELAGRLGIWVALGSAHPLGRETRPHNSIHVISDDGGIVARYDKRVCSATELAHFYTPGQEPVVFDVDGLRFGCALCVEVHFPGLFDEYERLGVDCVLLSAYPVASIFAVEARAHAAINNYWLALSVPEQTRHLFAACLFGPDGSWLADTAPDQDVLIADIDPDDPTFHVALHHARPWRARVRGRAEVHGRA